MDGTADQIDVEVLEYDFKMKKFIIEFYMPNSSYNQGKV
jgi:hypothetical protein